MLFSFLPKIAHDSIERGKNPTLNALIRLSGSLDVELAEIFSFIQAEDPVVSKSAIISLLEEADREQLKLLFKVISVVIKT